MDGVTNWFVETIRSVIMWQIRIMTSDIQSMILFTAAFDVLILTFAALAFWGGPKLGAITRIAAVGMVVVSIVIVALVRG